MYTETGSDLDDIAALVEAVNKKPSSVLANALHLLFIDRRRGGAEGLPLTEQSMASAGPNRHWRTVALLQRDPKLLAHVSRCENWHCRRWLYVPLGRRGRPRRSCGPRCAQEIRRRRNAEQMINRRGGHKRKPTGPFKVIWCDGRPVSAGKNMTKPRGGHSCVVDERTWKKWRDQGLLVWCTGQHDPAECAPGAFEPPGLVPPAADIGKDSSTAPGQRQSHNSGHRRTAGRRRGEH